METKGMPGQGDRRVSSSSDAIHRPRPAELRRWRQHLANERAEAAIYCELAQRRTGEERAILLALADAEARHKQYWLSLLGDQVGAAPRVHLRTRLLAFLARHFGFVFVLALIQRSEARTCYDEDRDATPRMAADEHIHAEVVRALATRGRDRLSGSLRPAVFGANDGLTTNLALILGISATGVSSHTVLATGLAGLLAGALSMGAGEYVSVNSQLELLEASMPSPEAGSALPQLDLDANELALVYRARGMSADEAERRAAEVLRDLGAGGDRYPGMARPGPDRRETVGTGLRAGVSSFIFFASGAFIPVLPYLLGLGAITALVVAAVLVGAALLATGAIVGLISGGSPLRPALRQLLIGYGAATVTYLLGLLFHTSVG